MTGQSSKVSPVVYSHRRRHAAQAVGHLVFQRQPSAAAACSWHDDPSTAVTA